MKKQDRIAEVQRLYEDEGKTFAEILTNETLGVTPATIKGDLLGLFPDDEEDIAEAFNAIPADPKADPKPKAEAKEPELSAGDKEYTRLTVEAIAFDAETGEPMGKPFTHTVNRRSWPQFIKNHKGTGLTVLTVDHLAPGLKPFDFDDYDKKTKAARARVMKFRKIQG